MNFHPDKQLVQVAGAVDRTTDPWITRPELYPYTTGDSLPEKVTWPMLKLQKPQV